MSIKVNCTNCYDDDYIFKKMDQVGTFYNTDGSNHLIIGKKETRNWNSNNEVSLNLRVD